MPLSFLCQKQDTNRSEQPAASNSQQRQARLIPTAQSQLPHGGSAKKHLLLALHFPRTFGLRLVYGQAVDLASWLGHSLPLPYLWHRWLGSVTETPVMLHSHMPGLAPRAAAGGSNLTVPGQRHNDGTWAFPYRHCHVSSKQLHIRA
ncbi:tudor domain-containing protein 10 [Platysternon megacephalum]|uniref:Tudor domain-containing protein 10 n=1 Tax=Platysternon megacephalum TaxID=55544 RepID=A0A4D9DSH9_9SAUR|nr:tudor domain-containing protein 10 [Platysternon megacephalum]